MKTIDIKLIKQYSQGDDEFLSSMLTIIVEELSLLTQQIPKLYTTQDWPQLMYLMDRLSDMSAYCGTEKVDHFARAACVSLRKNDFEKAQINIKALVKEIEASLQAAKELQKSSA